MTTSNGIPIGLPCQRLEPKSACKPVLAPIEEMTAAEFFAMGRRSTRWFHGFDFGKTGQRGAAGTRSALAAPPAAASTATAAEARRTRVLMAGLSAPNLRHRSRSRKAPCSP